VALLAVIGAGAVIDQARHGIDDGGRSASQAQPVVQAVADRSPCSRPLRHPDPVILVPGTFAATSWDVIGPALLRRGYCVFTLSYGNAGTLDIAGSAHQLAAAVGHVLARTGAHQVAIVGHSEGGMMPRYYIKRLGGAGKVSDLVALAPSNHGTTNMLTLAGAAYGCTACAQQFAWNSKFLAGLNAGDEAPPPVDYTVVQTRLDEVVTPYTSAFLSGPRARVTDVTLQDRCPGDAVDHVDVPTDRVAVQWVENALAVRGPADPRFRPRC